MKNTIELEEQIPAKLSLRVDFDKKKCESKIFALNIFHNFGELVLSVSDDHIHFTKMYTPTSYHKMLNKDRRWHSELFSAASTCCCSEAGECREFSHTPPPRQFKTIFGLQFFCSKVLVYTFSPLLFRH